MAQLKRALAVHDISCFGKCSLTVALPVLSAAGIETTVLPTAVLSTHTGGFEGFTYRDLTQDILPIVKHWKTLDLQFDAIYTGFLGSFEQIDIVLQLIEELRGSETKIIVDPVMADHGELYSLFPETFPAGMAKLCAVADVIVPNTTEAALLLGRSWTRPPYEPAVVDELLEALCHELGAKAAVLTDISFDRNHLGAASYDAATGEHALAQEVIVPEMYHGTGDVFSSALTAALMHGDSLAQSIEVAVTFTVESIRRSFAAQTDNRFGVDFEEGLSGLSALIENARR